MNTPDHLPGDAQPLDDRLREAYDFLSAPPDVAPPPPDYLWTSVESRLTPPAAAPWRLRVGRPALLGVLGVVVGVVVGVLVGWLLHFGAEPRPTTAAVVRASGRSATVTGRSAKASGRSATADQRSPTVSGRFATMSGRFATMSGRFATVSGRPVLVAQPAVLGSSVPAIPTVSIPAVPMVLLALVSTERAVAAVPADSGRLFRERRRAALLAQRAELARLRFRTDSLLLTLGEPLTAPPAAPTTDSLPLPAVRPLTNRWSVALSFAPERNFFGLQSPATDQATALRRTHEQGRAGYNASVMAEYRLDRRLSVGGGLGLTSYGAELRLTDRQIRISTRLDSSIVRSATVVTVIRDAYSVRTVADSVLAPILNANQQVTGYQYLPTTRPDTVWTRIENTRVDSLTTKTYTPVITTRQEASARILRPNYRFLTLPLLVRYRLGRDPADGTTASPTAPRWWADVALGAQLQFVLGGTQATTTDGGASFRTERVGATGGPFRPVTVALTGAVAFNYALTPRLSASVAPTLRWQPESVYKASTNLTQRPTATGVQVGVRYSF